MALGCLFLLHVGHWEHGDIQHRGRCYLEVHETSNRSTKARPGHHGSLLCSSWPESNFSSHPSYLGRNKVDVSDEAGRHTRLIAR